MTERRTLGLLLGSSLIGLALLLVAFQPAGARQTTVLYDGQLGGTPDTQGFSYIALGSAATQRFEDAVTILDTVGDRSDQAGYFGVDVPSLSRQQGYSVLFTLQLLQEAHASDHRAGLSLIVLSEDLQGIEMAFWTNEIWVQEGGAGELFTHAEGAAYDTAAALTAYELRVGPDSYTLLAGGETILTGPLRDYTVFEGLLDPYETPNLIFLGDNTSRAQAVAAIAYVALETEATPTATATATATATVTPGHTATSTVTATLPAATATALPPTATAEPPTRSPFWWLPCVKG